MAILSVTPIGISGGQARSGSVTRDGGRSYTRHFRVTTDGQDVGPRAVLQAIPVAIGQAYHANGLGESGESDDASFAASATANEEGEDGRSWVVTVEYSPYNAEINPVNPIDARPKISWTWEQTQRVVTKDKEGEPLVNSAGDFFVPAVEVEDFQPIFQIVRNESTLFPGFIRANNGAINGAPWFGEAAKMWKVVIGPAPQVFNPEIGYYWEVTYQFFLSEDEDGWIVPVADQGMRELYGDGSKIRHILDSGGEKITEPAALNEDGTKKAPGEKLDFLLFEVRKEIDFSVFGFDAFLASLTGG